MSDNFKKVFVSNDNIVNLIGLQDSETDVYVNTATVTAQVKDATDNNVGSSISLSFTSGSNGDYAGLIPDDLGLTKDAWYEIEVTANDGAGRLGFWETPFQAKQRV